MSDGGGTARPGRPGMLLDLDGTLVDSNYQHALAWWRALGDLGEWAPTNAIHRLVGMGGDQLPTELLGHDVPGASEARARRFAEVADEIRPFPAAADLVRTVRAAGVVVVLATSAPDPEIDRAVATFADRDLFDAVTSTDAVASSKPAPDVFVAAMETGGIDPGRCLAVGDSIWDVQAARAAGIGCVAVETGGFSRHELSEEGALAVYRDVAELTAQLRTSPLAVLLDR